MKNHQELKQGRTRGKYHLCFQTEFKARHFEKTHISAKLLTSQIGLNKSTTKTRTHNFEMIRNSFIKPGIIIFLKNKIGAVSLNYQKIVEGGDFI